MDTMKSAVIDLLNNQSWAILPEYLDTIHKVIYTRVYGGGADMAAIEAMMGKELDNKRDIKVNSGVAVIPIHGMIAKRMNLFQQISGGVSTEMLKKDIRKAADDKEITAIVLDIDSPGGTVDGTKELADSIFALRGQKPIVAYANGLMASAAIYIGAAADSITAYDTAQIGSIGVITEHRDYSVYDEKLGVKRTFITAGRYKAIGNDAEPLSDDAKAYIQKRLDDYYTLFVDDVARYRGVNSDDALKKWADGRMFIAGEALEIGLIDRIATLDETIIMAGRDAAQKSQKQRISSIDKRMAALMSKINK